MKQIIYVLSILIFLSSCEKDEVISSGNNNNSNNIEEIQIKVSDINGVWALSSNDMYFISFMEGGKYSFCFNNHLMGSGTFSLKGKEVSLYNSYSNKIEKMSVELCQGKLRLKGDVYLFDSERTEYFSGDFIKTTETASPSLVGVEKSGGLYGFGPYGETVYDGVTFISDNIAKHTHIFEYKDTGREKTTTRYYYYVYRIPIIYTQELEKDGYIVIYNTEEGQWPGRVDGQEL